MGAGAGGALLAEVAGGLLAEHGVLGSQAGDLCACGVQVLHDVLGTPLLKPGSQGVAELVTGHGDRLADLVAPLADR
jgi:hypothetical protein